MNDALTNRALPASLFRVRDDVSAEEVLLHLSEVLRVGEAAAYELTENPGFNAEGLALAVVHAMEAAQVLVGRLLEMEAA